MCTATGCLIEYMSISTIPNYLLGGKRSRIELQKMFSTLRITLKFKRKTIFTYVLRKLPVLHCTVLVLNYSEDKAVLREQ
jgi:hypothetical protein